jgi:hypothetical protein
MVHDEEILTELDHNDESFGNKTIGSFSGSMLLINNMMGKIGLGSVVSLPARCFFF